MRLILKYLILLLIISISTSYKVSVDTRSDDSSATKPISSEENSKIDNENSILSITTTPISSEINSTINNALSITTTSVLETTTSRSKVINATAVPLEVIVGVPVGLIAIGILSAIAIIVLYYDAFKLFKINKKINFVHASPENTDFNMIGMQNGNISKEETNIKEKLSTNF
jgi:hypothetical protein